MVISTKRLPVSIPESLRARLERVVEVGGPTYSLSNLVVSAIFRALPEIEREVFGPDPKKPRFSSTAIPMGFGNFTPFQAQEPPPIRPAVDADENAWIERIEAERKREVEREAEAASEPPRKSTGVKLVRKSPPPTDDKPLVSRFEPRPRAEPPLGPDVDPDICPHGNRWDSKDVCAGCETAWEGA